ncbi:MAG: valine--tRNA ligase [Methanobacteriota archaeon]
MGPEPVREAVPDRVDEERWLAFWEDERIYRYDPASPRPVFSIDTPPPTVSGRMHIGHAYSYNQMDFVARYKRMRGYNLFYPFGFDDNGLPTERLTERETGVRLHDVGRKEFIRRCLEVTQRYEASMEESWRRIGTSCDWSLVYRTIDDLSRKTSQRSFLLLANEGRAYRAERPSIWCPECATAIAQVEAEDRELPSTFNDITFDLAGPADAGPGGERHGDRLVHRETGPDGKEEYHYHQGADAKIVVSTTRPELIPACVAVFVHPADPRTRHLVGRMVRVPLTGHEVPILASDRVDKEKGTGVVMCCTFGDLTDIDWWAEHKLPLRIAIDPHGRMTRVAGPYHELKIEDARKKVLADLDGGGRLLHQAKITHAVNVHERCGTPVEFLVTKQWFVSYLDQRDAFLARGAAVRWHPDYMKVRYDNWVKGLKWDWCISRQRYFGVPFPVWYCAKCATVKFAEESELPVDPLDTKPATACGTCGGADFAGEKDVMDTWATSSLTPQIALRWVEGAPAWTKCYPMDLRPQAHEIISFWAFNTIVKSHFHHGKVPWGDIMISGFVKLGKGKKMSKSKGEVIEPLEVIREHSGDALRYWSATGAQLGEDIIWNPKDLTRAQRLVTKLRNVNRFIARSVPSMPPAPKASDLHATDRWVLAKYAEAVEAATRLWDEYDYNRAVKVAEDFLWHTLADHYVELVKHRVYQADDRVAKWVLATVGLGTTKLLAPVLCFVTEEIYQEHYRAGEGATSVHVAAWPTMPPYPLEGADEGALVAEVVAAVRAWKSEKGFALNAPIPEIEVVPGPHEALLRREENDIAAPSGAPGLRFVGASEVREEVVGLKPNLALVGPRFKEKAGAIGKALEGLEPVKAAKDLATGKLHVPVNGEGVTLSGDEVRIERRPTLHGKKVDLVRVRDVVLLLRVE